VKVAGGGEAASARAVNLSPVNDPAVRYPFMDRNAVD
jgi:hypothetical protein